MAENIVELVGINQTAPQRLQAGPRRRKLLLTAQDGVVAPVPDMSPPCRGPGFLLLFLLHRVFLHVSSAAGQALESEVSQLVDLGFSTLSRWGLSALDELELCREYLLE